MKITVTVEDPNDELLSRPGSTVNLIVQFRLNGNLLDDSRIPNNLSFTVDKTLGLWNLEIPVTTSTYNYPALDAFVYVGALTDCCFAKLRVSLISTSGGRTSFARQFVFNTTGYGFDWNAEHGIAPEFLPRALAFKNMSYNGNNFNGLHMFRLNVKWYEYEPTEGTFRDAKIHDAIDWCISQNLTFSVSISDWLLEGDSRIPDSDKAKLQDGRTWHVEAEDNPSLDRHFCPSLRSTIGKTKFNAAVARLSALMHSRQPDKPCYIAKFTAQTEEYQVVREEATLLTTGYGDVDRAAWSSYSGGQPIPTVDATSQATAEAGYHALRNTPVGQTWYQFQTLGLKTNFESFAAAVRSGGCDVMGMYAGVDAPSQDYDFIGNLDQIFPAADMIYSSEGDPNLNWRKLFAADLNSATFPDMGVAMEFDHMDLDWEQAPPYEYGNNLNPDILYNYSCAFFNRDGKYIHWAMSFDPAKIPQLYARMYQIINGYFNTNNLYTPPAQGLPINTTSSRGFTSGWQTNGGSTTTQVKIIMKTA